MKRTLLLAAAAFLIARTTPASAQEVNVSRAEKCQPATPGKKQCATVSSRIDCAARRFSEAHSPGPSMTLSEAVAKQYEDRWKIGQMNIPKECEPFTVEEMSEGIIAVFVDTAKLGTDGYVADIPMLPAPAPAPEPIKVAPPVSVTPVMGPEGPASHKPLGEQLEAAEGIMLKPGDITRLKQTAEIAVRDGQPVWRITDRAVLSSILPFDGVAHTVWAEVNTGLVPHDRMVAELTRGGVVVARWSMAKVYVDGTAWFRLDRELPAGTREMVFEPKDLLTIELRNAAELPTKQFDLLKVKLVRAK